MCVSGSAPEPGQLVAVEATSAPYSGPLALPRIGGANGDGSYLYFFRRSSACARSSGVKSMRSSGTLMKLRAYAGGLVGNGCVADSFSPGTSDCGTGRSSIGHTGWPVTRSKTYRKACLPGRATALIALPATLISARIGAEERS